MPARGLIALSSVIMYVVAATLIATRPASAYEHLRNGSFEDGLSGWSARPDTTLTIAPDDELSPFDGASSGKVVLAGTRFEIRTNTAATLGPGTYRLSAHILTASTGITVTAELNGASFTESTDVAPPAGAWTEVSITAVSGAAGDVSVAISGAGDPGDVLYVDAVTLEGAPPVTLTPTQTLLPATTPTPGQTAAAATSPTPSPQPTSTPADVIAAQLRNASFEQVDADGIPVAWQKYGGVLSSASSPARSGERAARLDSATPSTKWLYQTVLVDPGATYAFDAWVWHDDPAVASAFLRVSWYASADGSGEAIGTSDSTSSLDSPMSVYRSLSTGPATAPPGTRSAKLRIMLAPASSAAATIFVDDASFGPATPLPNETGTTTTSDGSDARASSGTGRSSRVAGRMASGEFVAAESPSNAGARATLVINEVLYDPDIAGADASGEWVEIYNTGDAAISLIGWTLRDNVRPVALPEIVVPAHDFAIVAASDSFFRAYPEVDGVVGWLGARVGNGLGNAGDRLELIGPGGAIVDALSWGDDTSVLDPPVDAVPAGHSIERRAPGADTDRADDFVDNEAPSPGRALDTNPANPKPRNTSNVEILEASGSGNFGWIPWAMLALSTAALAGTVGWRTLDALRGRSRAT